MNFQDLKLSTMSPGTYTIRAIFDGDDTYNATETEFILVVSEHPEGTQYQIQDPSTFSNTNGTLSFNNNEVEFIQKLTNTYKLQEPNNPMMVDYTWTSSGGTIDPITKTFTVSEAGTYTLTVTGTNGATASYTLTINDGGFDTDTETETETGTETDIQTDTQTEIEEDQDKFFLYFDRQLVYQQTNSGNVYSLQTPKWSLSNDGTVPQSILSNCYWTIDNNPSQIAVSATQITIPNEGQHIIYLHFTGNNEYEPHIIAYTLGVSSQADLNKQKINLRFVNTYIQLNNNETQYELAFTMAANASNVSSSDFHVTISQTGSNSTQATASLDLNRKIVTINNLTSGKTYNVQLRFDGDDNWNSATTTSTVSLTTQEQTSDYVNQYLTFESLEDGNEVVFKGSFHSTTKTIQWSTNKTNWTSATSTRYVNYGDGDAILTTLNTGDKLYLRGDNENYSENKIVPSKRYNVYGNIMSLISSTNFKTLKTLSSENTFSGSYNSYGIFCNTPVVNAKNLILPATTLTEYCYREMFKGCTSLTTAPELPATTLATDCYEAMFYGCTSLTTAPELPATTLAGGCYRDMFYGCTSLTTAQRILPATTLANYCYRAMFYGCTSLTTAPILPASDLPGSSTYEQMFYNCTSLNYIKMLAYSVNGYSSQMFIILWVHGVPSGGIFVKHPNSPIDIYSVSVGHGDDGIPQGWTIQTATS